MDRVPLSPIGQDSTNSAVLGGQQVQRFLIGRGSLAVLVQTPVRSAEGRGWRRILPHLRNRIFRLIPLIDHHRRNILIVGCGRGVAVRIVGIRIVIVGIRIVRIASKPGVIES